MPLDSLERLAGPRSYQSWARRKTPFTAPAIAQAFTRFRSLVLAPGRVAGGLQSVLQTQVDEAWRPLLAQKPGCALYQQADSAASWMSEGTTIGPKGTVNWFVLPGATAAAAPIIVGGDLAVQFHRGRDVDRLMAYLAGPQAGESWVKKGGFLSPKITVPAGAYPDAYLSTLTSALRRAGTVTFDDSDQMPPEIGSSLLWKEITRWIAGSEDYSSFAKNIDTAYRTKIAATVK